jgi:hypothetical protein
MHLTVTRSVGNGPHGLGSTYIHEGVSKSFRTGLLERELQMVQLSAIRCSCIAILWVSLVSLAAITLCVASQRVFVVVVVVVVYFVIDSYIHIYIPCILKFVVATVGCAVSHKGTKHTDKCRKKWRIYWTWWITLRLTQHSTYMFTTLLVGIQELFAHLVYVCHLILFKFSILKTQWG